MAPFPSQEGPVGRRAAGAMLRLCCMNIATVGACTQALAGARATARSSRIISGSGDEGVVRGACFAEARALKHLATAKVLHGVQGEAGERGRRGRVARSSPARRLLSTVPSMSVDGPASLPPRRLCVAPMMGKLISINLQPAAHTSHLSACSLARIYKSSLTPLPTFQTGPIASTATSLGAFLRTRGSTLRWSRLGPSYMVTRIGT